MVKRNHYFFLKTDIHENYISYVNFTRSIIHTENKISPFWIHFNLVKMKHTGVESEWIIVNPWTCRCVFRHHISIGYMRIQKASSFFLVTTFQMEKTSFLYLFNEQIWCLMNSLAICLTIRMKTTKWDKTFPHFSELFYMWTWQAKIKSW